MGNIIDQGSVLLMLGIESSATASEKAIVQAAISDAEAKVKKYLQYDPVLRSHTEYYPRMYQSRGAEEHIWEADASVAYERRSSGASSDELQLQHLPIRTDTAIQLWIDYDGRGGARSGAFGLETLKTGGDDYWPNYDGEDDDGNLICRDGIIRSVGLWPLEPGSVKVTYNAGYSDDEFNGSKDLVDATSIYVACMEEAVRRAKKVFVNMKSTMAGFVAGPMTSENLGEYSYSIDSATANKLFGNAASLLGETREMLEDYVNLGIMLGG